MEGREEAAGAGAQGLVEDGLQGREAGDHDADADFDLGPEHVARVGPGCVDVVDVGDGPAAEDGGGAGTGVWEGWSVGRFFGGRVGREAVERVREGGREGGGIVELS